MYITSYKNMYNRLLNSKNWNDMLCQRRYSQRGGTITRTTTIALRKINMVISSSLFILLLLLSDNNNSVMALDHSMQILDLDGGLNTATPAPPKNLCPMSQTKTKPSAEPSLKYCNHYSNNACCTPEEDLAVEKEINTYWRSLTGHCPGCLENARRFHCAYKCSPDMANFVKPKAAPAGLKTKAGTLKMCTAFCKSWFNSCVNTSIAERFSSNAPAFCMSMIDSAKGSVIKLSSYACFNDADAANTCEGASIPPLPKDATNIWFIITCVILGVTGCILVTAIFVADSPVGPGPVQKNYEHVNQREEETPLFSTPADATDVDVDVR